MKTIIKTIKLLVLIIIFFFIIIGLFLIIPARTPAIKSKPNNSINQLEFIRIGGIEQSVLIRSENQDNPILLFLHGGPGMPMMYMAHEFQRPLEEHFTVVQWDRRGAGKTFARNVPSYETMNIRQILNDSYELIDTLRNRFNKNKIILAGHSFGTYVGSILVHERPELFSSYISIGQVVDEEIAAEIQKEFIRNKAIQNERQEILEELQKPGNPKLEPWLFKFGGEIKNAKSYFPLVWSGLKSPEYTLKEVFKVSKGSSFSSKHMKYNVLDGQIKDEIIEYKVPVYFFTGEYDVTTPTELIQEYFLQIDAADKKLILFHNSAHFPFIEESERFCQEILKVTNP